MCVLCTKPLDLQCSSSRVGPKSSQPSQSSIQPNFAQLGPGFAEFRMAFSSYGPGESGGNPGTQLPTCERFVVAGEKPGIFMFIVSYCLLGTLSDHKWGDII